MNYILISALSFFICSFLACKCLDEECPVGENKSIRFISKTDSADLIISGQYSLDSLTITPLPKKFPGKPANIYISHLANGKYLIYVEINEDLAGYVFRLHDLPPDTLLAVTGKLGGDECCADIVTWEEAILNGDTLPNIRDDWEIEIAK